MTRTGITRALLALALTCLASQAHAALALAPCRLEHPSHLVAIEAECGTLTVPEDPLDPHGRSIGIAVARVPAISRHRKADALFILPGGPGMAASTFYTAVAAAFARIHRDRDIVLVDQRGTGGSNALTCQMNEEALWRAADAALTAETAKCLAALNTHAQPAFYTTSLAVGDLDRVRAALGYEHINLYGASYGTRVAQQYLRRFPTRTRTTILDGVVPPPALLGPALALDAQAALEAILARCAAEPSCRARFGDPLQSYRALRATLDAHPVAVHLPDPASGAPVDLEFTSLHLAAVLRLSSYTSEQAALLPLVLTLAARDGNFAPLAAQFLMVDRSYDEALAYGMHNAVVCSEDVPFYDPAHIDRERLARTYLGSSQLDALMRVCAHWPRGPVDTDLHAPLHSAVPVLLLSGSDDPVTPPAYAEQAQRGLEHALSVVVRGTGHGQIADPCVGGLMARFIDAGTTDGLDVSCTQRVRPFSFFTSLAGPPP
jgi:pimeloyl-ACP methyl ester carboxylesterase